jgi:hypothetical protein
MHNIALRSLGNVHFKEFLKSMAGGHAFTVLFLHLMTGTAIDASADKLVLTN